MSINPGAFRFNTDSMKLEIFRGSANYEGTASMAGIGTLAAGQWEEIQATSPDVLTGGTRGVFSGGITPSTKDELDYINISSTGNAIDFGNLTEARGGGGGAGDRSRGLLMGGYTVPAYSVTIDFWTFASTGDAIDFGDLSTAGRGFCQATSNSTRAINGGGWNPASETLDYVTIQSTGDAKDFGELSVAREVDVAAGSPTRGIWAGGLTPTGPNQVYNIIEYITFATQGNAADFGDLATGSWGGSGSGNAIRMIIFGGQTAPSPATFDGSISSITIATLGNAVEFGEALDTTAQARGGCSSSTRALSGGHNAPTSDEIEYLEIATLGDSIDFGDLTVARHYPAGCSNGHGGL